MVACVPCFLPGLAVAITGTSITNKVLKERSKKKLTKKKSINKKSGGGKKRKSLKKELYKPFKSNAKHKKYSVYVKGKSGNPKLIHFGDNRYQQFKDKIGHYSHLDHGDSERKKRYYQRHGKATSKDTPKYWAHKILW